MLGVAILAAGASRRMGRIKTLLPWRNGTILGSLVSQWRGLGAETVAVVHAGEESVIREISAHGAAEVAVERGEMIDSIRAAAAWRGWPSGLERVAFVLGDQPHLPTTVLAELLDLADRYPDRICQPEQGGRGRHPVIVPAARLGEIASCHESTFAEFLHGANPLQLPVPETAFGEDIDNPDDYARQIRRSKGGWEAM